MQENKLSNYLHLHFIVFIWGFTAVLGKLISIDAIPLVLYRLAIASMFLFGYLLIKKIRLKISTKQLLYYFIGGIIIAIHWIAFFYAIKISNVSITLATLATGAFFASVLEPLFFKTKIKAYEIILSVLTFIGIAIIFKVESEFSLGIIIALIAAFLSALFTVINADFIKENDASVISFYELLFATFFMTVVALFQSDFDLSYFNIPEQDWIYIFILGSICTAYALTASTKLLKKISPFTMILTVNLEPVYGIILALLVFGNDEKMETSFYYGAILIFIGVIFNSVIKLKKNDK